jgi:hypothetical protein
MTSNDDWARFDELMRAAGWEPIEVEGCYRHRETGVEHDARHDWRTWLEAGQTPPPF